MSQAKIWYVVVDGKPQGPHTQDEIQGDLKAEKITYSDLVFRPGLSRWMTVGECQEFERRKEDGEKNPGHTVAKMGVPSGEEAPDDHWVILVKQLDEKGKPHYVQSGPYSGEVVKKKLNNGELKYSDHIWKKGQKSWEVISALDVFERRSEVIPEGIPAQASSFDDAATVVMTSAGLKEALKVKKEEAKEAKKEETKAEDTSEIIEDKSIHDDDEFAEKKRAFPISRKRMFIVGGASLGVAIAYAALNVLTESPDLRGPRKVASVHAAPVQVAQPAAPAPVASVAPVANVSRAVNPELENRPPKKPGVLKIVSLKTNSEHPQIVLETDLPGGTQIDIQVTARAGSILKYPSYEMSKKVVVVEGQLPTVDFTQDKLPPGDYHVSIKGGVLETNAPFSIGDHDEDFQKRLAQFKAKVLIQRKKEKAGLDDGVKFVSRSYASLTSEYRKAKTTSGNLAKKRWTIMVRSWRKDFERQSGMLKNVEDKNRNYFVFPDALLKLKAVEAQLNDVAQLYDKSVKTGRSIASETDMNDVFLDHLKDLRESVRRIK